MKIRTLTPENYPKASALLRQAFPNSRYEERLFDNLHKKQRTIYEWVSIHSNMYVAYIAFTHAYNGNNICGLHLAPLAVNPQYQNQGIGTEMIRFALRQNMIKDTPVYVLGNPEFYQKFGFELCSQPICPLARNNRHFLALRSTPHEPFTIGYEPEFMKGAK
jgi:putative acetyltransferase